MVFMAARCRWLLVAKREQSSKTFDTFAKFTTLASPETHPLLTAQFCSENFLCFMLK